MSDTGKGAAAAPITPAPYPAKFQSYPRQGPDQTTLYSQSQRWNGQGYNQQKGPKMNSLFSLLGKIIAIVEMVLTGLFGLAWIVVLGLYIDGSIRYYKEYDDDRKNQYRYYYDGRRSSDYGQSELHHPNPYSQDHHGFGGEVRGMLLLGISLGFAIELGLLIVLGVGVFCKSFSSCMGWFSARIAFFILEFGYGFVRLCGDRYAWWPILIVVIYLLYRICSIAIIFAFGFDIYRNRKRPQQEQPQTMSGVPSTNQMTA